MQQFKFTVMHGTFADSQAHGVYVSYRIFLLKEASQVLESFFFFSHEKKEMYRNLKVLKQRNAIRGTCASDLDCDKLLCDQILNLFYLTFIIAAGD